MRVWVYEPRPAQGGWAAIPDCYSLEQWAPSPPAPSWRAFSICTPTLSYLLLRTGPRQVQWRAGGVPFYLRPNSGIEALPWAEIRIPRPSKPMPELVRLGEISQGNLKLVKLPLPPKCSHPKGDCGHADPKLCLLKGEVRIH